MAKTTKTSNAGGKAKPTKQKVESSSDLTGTDPGLLALFIDGIRDIYWAENQLVKCLPKMQQSASGGELAEAIETHLEETKTHVARLDQVFDLLGERARAQKCDAMEGLTKEGEAIIEKTMEGTAARDMGIVMASRKVEHYEMAAYEGLVNLATKLGMQDVAALLQDTLTEEQDADAILAEITVDDAPEA